MTLSDMLKTMFRFKYGYINDENLKKAAENEPELILVLIDYGDLGNVALGATIEALGYTYDKKHLSKIKEFLKHDHELVKDGAQCAIDMITDKD